MMRTTPTNAHPRSGTTPDAEIDEEIDGAGTSDGLMRAVAHGDEQAFVLLYDRLAPPVLGMIRAVVGDPARAEEIAREVFVELWRTAARYRTGQGGVIVWVMTMAHRLAVDRVRDTRAGDQRAGRQRAAIGAGQARDRPYGDVIARTLANSGGQPVRRCLLALAEQERTSMVLAYYGARTYREVAAMLAVAPNAVLTLMRDGLRQLGESRTEATDTERAADPHRDSRPGVGSDGAR